MRDGCTQFRIAVGLLRLAYFMIHLVSNDKLRVTPEQSIEDYNVLNQSLGHIFEELHRSGTQLYNITVIVQSLNVKLMFPDATMLNPRNSFIKATEWCQ